MSTTRRIAFWATTLLLAFVLLSGGIAEFGRMWGTTETVTILGYPTYILTIIGAWKVAATVVLFLPIGGALKEWTYAGIFFNMTGAAASHALSGDFGPGAFHIWVTLGLAVLALVLRALAPKQPSQSWARLRVWGRLPRSRQLVSSTSTP